MIEPKVEQIRVALRDSLKEIRVEDGYYFSPTIYEVEGFWRAHFDDQSKVWPTFQLRQDRRSREEETSRTYSVVLEFWLMLAHRYMPSSELPWKFPLGQDFAATIQNRMVSDVTRKLTGGDGYMLGGLTDNLEIDDERYAVYLDGWVLVELRILAKTTVHRDEI